MPKRVCKKIKIVKPNNYVKEKICCIITSIIVYLQHEDKKIIQSGVDVASRDRDVQKGIGR